MAWLRELLSKAWHRRPWGPGDLFDFAMLKPTKHMLRFFGKDPFGRLRTEIESALKDQVPGSRRIEFRVVSEPQWLTGMRQSEYPQYMLLVRAGVAFAFCLQTDGPVEESREICGVCSWVGIHLDMPNNSQSFFWMEIDGKLAELGSEGKLKLRLYLDTLGH